MPFNWRLLFLTALLTFKAPEFVMDPNHFLGEYYNGMPFPRTVPQLFSRPDGRLLEDRSVLQIGSENDSTENAWKSKASLPLDKPQKRLDICLIADICLASDSPLTGNISFSEVNEMKGSVSVDYRNFMSVLQAELHIGAYLETIINMFPETWQPGPVFYRRAKMVMSMAPALDVLMILVFIWRRMKNRTNQSPNKPFLDGLWTSSSHHHDRKLKACVGQLQRDIMTQKRREDRRKRAELFKKKFEQSEMDLQQKLEQLEQEWTEKFQRSMEESCRYDRCLEEIQALQHKLCKTAVRDVAE